MKWQRVCAAAAGAALTLLLPACGGGYHGTCFWDTPSPNVVGTGSDADVGRADNRR
jgi:hypothetical protein